MHEGTTEERFEAAVRNLCQRWESFDFIRRVQSVDSNVAGGHDPDYDEFVPHPAKLLGRGVADFGGVAAVKQRLQTEAEDDAILGLAASNRLDLTIEFLALRPAWKTLFDETERRTAADRLFKFVSLSSLDRTTPSAGDDLGRMVDWLVEQIARWEVDRDLPKSRVKYGWQDPSQRTEQSWCASLADSAREFSEIGLIVTSLTQCSHYLHCPQCNRAFPELEKPFRRFETTMTSQCHELLRLLGVCLERALLGRALPAEQAGSMGQGDEFAWRAIICGAGLTYFDSIGEFSRILSGVAHGGMLEPPLRQVLNLSQDEIHLLSFVKTASSLLIEVQWFLYGNDDFVYLPSDGDLWDISGAVVVLPAPEIGEWKRLMTGSDLEFPKRDGRGRETTLTIDGIGLFMVLNAAAVLQGQKLALNPMRGVREVADAERSPAPRIESADYSLTGSRREGLAQTLLDRITDLCDLVASNSAAQIPIIDTLQAVANKIGNPSRAGAEESLRQELGDPLYGKLFWRARQFAVAAEYHWLDANAPDPSKIVADLATAFEHELRETVFRRFCEALLASGIRNYPERPGALPSVVTGSASERPRPGLPARSDGESDVPNLLENGVIKQRLNLGEMKRLLDRPLPSLTNFLTQKRLQIRELVVVLREITKKRNLAVHEGQPSEREEVSQIRRRWLGKTEDFPNIFAVLAPGVYAARAPDTGQ